MPAQLFNSSRLLCTFSYALAHAGGRPSAGRTSPSRDVCATDNEKASLWRRVSCRGGFLSTYVVRIFEESPRRAPGPHLAAQCPLRPELVFQGDAANKFLYFSCGIEIARRRLGGEFAGRGRNKKTIEAIETGESPASGRRAGPATKGIVCSGAREETRPREEYAFGENALMMRVAIRTRMVVSSGRREPRGGSHGGRAVLSGAPRRRKVIYERRPSFQYFN